MNSPFRLRSLVRAAIAALALLIILPSARAQSIAYLQVVITNTPSSPSNSITIGGVTLTWTNTPAASTDVQIGATLAADASNLWTALSTNSTLNQSGSGVAWTNAYFPGSTSFTITALPGVAVTNLIVGGWGYALGQTNWPGGSSLVITNSGATISNLFTPFSSVALTNLLTLPSLTALRNGYSPGVTFLVCKVDALTNGLAVTAGTGTAIIGKAGEFRDGGTNNVQLAASVAYGSGVLQDIFTNGLMARYTWLGDTNYFRH